MTLIRELIDIPTQVQDGDFVLKLTQGIAADPVGTVDDYVVTEQLARAFDEALGLVASALADSESKAAFLQGSFGSGKSHFMAILHLLLQPRYTRPGQAGAGPRAVAAARMRGSTVKRSSSSCPYHMVGREIHGGRRCSAGTSSACAGAPSQTPRLPAVYVDDKRSLATELHSGSGLEHG